MFQAIILCNLKRKTNAPNLRKWQKKKLILNLILACFTQIFVTFTSIRCWTLLQVIIVCNFKEYYWTELETMAKYPVSRPILASLAKYGPQSFLSISPLLDVIHCCKLSLYAISRKTNDPNLKIQSWENLVTDRCTDRQTEGPRDEKDFIGCCPTNVKRPKKEKLTQKL